MAHSSKHGDSSTESSEDEEESRKIKEALCDESIFKAHKTADQNNPRTSSELKNREAKVGPVQVEVKQKSTLKSNRLLDKNDDNEDDNILKTTPEFRAYVAKQLFSMLDGVLVDSMKDKVWHAPPPGNTKTTTGIRLFSDSKTLCIIGDVQKESQMQHVEPNKATSATYKHRKHKLSSSSESSDDEKISACVFSVADIQKENECLAFLEKQAVAVAKEQSVSEPDINIKSTPSQVSNNNTLDNHNSVVKKKKKKKRKKDKNKAKTNCITLSV